MLAQAPHAKPRARGRIRGASGAVQGTVHGLWLQDIESLEAISQDEIARRLFLKMAAMQQTGRLGSFLHELEDDQDLDDATKGTLTELAQDTSFLLAVEDYLRRTTVVH